MVSNGRVPSQYLYQVQVFSSHYTLLLIEQFFSYAQTPNIVINVMSSWSRVQSPRGYLIDTDSCAWWVSQAWDVTTPFITLDTQPYLDGYFKHEMWPRLSSHLTLNPPLMGISSMRCDHPFHHTWHSTLPWWVSQAWDVTTPFITLDTQPSLDGYLKHEMWPPLSSHLTLNPTLMGISSMRCDHAFHHTWHSTLPWWVFQAWDVTTPFITLDTQPSLDGYLKHEMWPRLSSHLTLNPPLMGISSMRCDHTFHHTWHSTLPWWVSLAWDVTTPFITLDTQPSLDGYLKHEMWPRLSSHLTLNPPLMGISSMRCDHPFHHTWHSTLPWWVFQAWDVTTPFITLDTQPYLDGYL